MAGKKTPTTLNGNAINDGTIYVSTFTIDSSIGDVFESSVVTAEVARQFDQYVGSQPQGRVLTMRTKLMRHGTANHYADMTQLKKWCSARQGEIVLKATDQASSPLTLRLNVKPLACVPVEGVDWIYETRFWVSKPVWENDTADDSTQTVDSTAELWTITNDGSDTVEPRTTITPNHYKAAANGPIYQKRIVVAPRSAQPHQDAYGNPYPFEITGGGWAGLETHRKNGVVHPAGYDIRVFVDDVEVPRYISGMGTGFGTGNDDEGASGGWATWEDSPGALAYHGQRFKISGCSENERITVDDIRLWLKKTGAPTGNLALEIRTESGGLPSNVIADSGNGLTNNLDVSTLTTSFVEKTFIFAANPTLTAETWYWLVIKVPSGTHNATNYVAFANTLIDAAAGANYEGEYFTTAHSATGSSGWTRGGDMFGNGLHSSTDALAVIDFRVYTTHNAKIWVPMAMPGMVKLSLGSALQNTDAVITGNDTVLIAAAEGNSRLPARCAVVIGTECIILNGKVGTHSMRIVKRGARGTTYAAHDSGTAIYWVPFDIRLVYGHANFDDLGKPTEYESRAHAPVIDGVTSTNEQFKWIGPFLGIDEETRPMVWRPESDDTVDLDEYVTLDMDPTNDDADITFKDALPSGAYLQRNVLTQHLPTGIEAAAAAITLDEASIPPTLAIRHYLTNERGEEELNTTHRSVDSGSGKQITPTSEAYRYRIQAVIETIVGTPTPSSPGDETIDSSSNANDAQTFRLDEESVILGVMVYVKAATTIGASATLDFSIIGTRDPTVTTDPRPPNEGVVYAGPVSIAAADVPTSYAWRYKAFDSPVVLAAGTYALKGGQGGSGYTGTGRWAKFTTTIYSGGEHWNETSSNTWTAVPAEDMAFRLVGSSAAQQASVASGDTCSLDNIIINLDDVTPQTPQVIFESADTSCVLIDGVLENTTPIRLTAAQLAEIASAAELPLDVTSPEPFRFLPKVIQIESEQMRVTALTVGTPNVITVGTSQRGYNSTSDVEHASGTDIYELYQTVTVKAVMQTGQELDIDWAKRTVTLSDTDRADLNAFACLSDFDFEIPFRLEPGANKLKWSETGWDGTHTLSVRTRYRENYL